MNNNKESSVFWRGDSEDGSETIAPDAPGETLGNEPTTIFLAVDSPGNRQQLMAHLGHQNELLLPQQLAQATEAFDLAVLDIGGLKRWHNTLQSMRLAEQPVFLPVMLILTSTDLGRGLGLGPYAGLVDEFLVTPIDRRELTQRVDMLLRARRLALAQRARLAYFANYDYATRLPNKTLFMDRLGQVVQDASVLDREAFVIAVNVPLTAILKSLGSRGLEAAALAYSVELKSLLGHQLSLSRLGTEQWGLIIRPGASIEDVLAVCNTIQRTSSKPLDIEGELVHVSPQVGIAVFPADGTDAHTLIDRAMGALTNAGRKAAPAFYSRSVQEQALRHIRTESGLHEALRNEQFELWLQPKVLLSDARQIGAEALVRWRLPSGELVPPNNFIPVAEATGLVTRIDAWMLRSACDAMQRLLAKGSSIRTVAVNMSPQHLSSPGFVGMVKDVLSNSGLAADALELELTETALADLSADNIAQLRDLRDHGVGIALDDFGTGYCSLSYLHKLPITTLKIDRSFVSGLPEDATSAAITRTIVALAKNFDLEIVAEGIETEVQADFLRSLGVTVGQGYLFGRPQQYIPPHLKQGQARKKRL